MIRPLVLATFLLTFLGASAAIAQSSHGPRDYTLGPGDIVRITVFRSPELTTETRVSEGGYISFPLLGRLLVKGVPPLALEGAIEQKLREGGFVKNPQVTVAITQFRSMQVSVLGQVNKPGTYYLDRPQSILEVLAMAGGMTSLGGDVITLVTHEGSTERRMQLDVHECIQKGNGGKDRVVRNGDIVYVPRYPVFYIYGNVNRPGQYRVERNMTVKQALAMGGGPTLRGTQDGMRLTRKDASGKSAIREADLDELIHADDVLYVRERLF